LAATIKGIASAMITSSFCDYCAFDIAENSGQIQTPITNRALII
jgi:hypothetical protein